MSIWKNDAVKASNTSKEDERTPISQMSPLQRAEATENYSEWVENVVAEYELTLSKMTDAGYITEAMAVEIIGKIETYYIGVEFSGKYISKKEDLEDEIFGGVLIDVEKGSGLALGVEAVRDNVFKASKYKAKLFKLEAAERKAKRDTKEDKTTLEDHLQEEDTSDKEVTSSRGKKGKKGKGK